MATLTIVLAEDDEDLRSVLAGLLRRDGYAVLEIGDGHGLMAAIASRRLDRCDLEDQDLLVITDWRMPGVDGLAVMRAAIGQGKHPQFMMMTAFGDHHIHEEARRLGALAVFDKPFDFDDLRLAVRKVAEELRGQR
jgi:CheY-like chemotaxis protein